MKEHVYTIRIRGQEAAVEFDSVEVLGFGPIERARTFLELNLDAPAIFEQQREDVERRRAHRA